MSRSLSYKNVSKRRFNCMKSTMRARVHDFARKNNYRITVWQVPDKDSGRWHIKLESSKIIYSFNEGKLSLSHTAFRSSLFSGINFAMG
jgi:hypothetical protein